MSEQTSPLDARDGADSPHGVGADDTGAAVRLARQDWPAAATALDDRGWAVLPGVLTAPECRETAALYEREELFRSRVVMARHGFGRGEYQYFGYPLPSSVAALRVAAYARLAPLADRWHERLGVPERFPDTLEAFLAECRAAGQSRPTPLLLRYSTGDYNCLHQDLYGARTFPFQLVVLLAAPGEDFTRGEFVLTEQRPRRQSRVDVVPLGRGDAVVFAVHRRPVPGARGWSRATLRHGVSAVRAGRRHTLGIVFHDAR
jgi:hypothetical protein